ncbi:uncharacterized protein B0P05DRAFT_574930 [Gilbertella persicaria]|uniref:uncharacterized protein n=1 Tax=Gilbertella persicaria TaxID=101096 RepID=UPI00221EC39E|nr:uncharacterized protein B0P05DRAFT_574930 [Gilbertella persicaria]KAI8059026.1 hypothetical protein B0P05DRAFT_574930 [Gilbertella persicaria]
MSPAISFCLYQIPTPMVTPPRAIYSQQRLENQPSFSNYFCLEDLFAIFDLHLTSHDLYKFYLQYPSLFCKDKEGRSYVQTNLMADVALKHNICNLSDLCRLSEEDLLKGGAIPLLKMTTFVRLFQKLSIVSLDKFEPRPLDGNEWFFSSANNTAHLVKLEPISPTFSTLHHAKPSPR